MPNKRAITQTQICFALDRVDAERLRAFAQKNGITVSEVIRNAVDAALKSNPAATKTKDK